MRSCHIIDVENFFIKSLLCFVCGHICSGKKFDYKPEDRKMARCHVCFNGCSSKLVELIYGFPYSPTVHMPRTLLRKKSVHSPPWKPPWGCDLGQQGFRCCPQCARAHCCTLAGVWKKLCGWSCSVPRPGALGKGTEISWILRVISEGDDCLPMFANNSWWVISIFSRYESKSFKAYLIKFTSASKNMKNTSCCPWHS